jgi:hypothetical protein
MMILKKCDELKIYYLYAITIHKIIDKMNFRHRTFIN